MSQLLGVFACRKLANLCLKTLSLKRANNVPKLQGVDYVAKNWALAMMLKALSLVHLWRVLFLKEKKMTSVRKTLKMLVWLAQNRSISGEIYLENNYKIGGLGHAWGRCAVARFVRSVVSVPLRQF